MGVSAIGPGLFFTGSDTEVGKTRVAAAVARCLRRLGQEVAVCKPVATGATWVDGRWLSQDTVRLAEAAQASDVNGITPYAFPEAAAPPLAARQCGVDLTLEGLADAVRRQARPGKVLLVEGVGGLLCPLTERESVADLAGLLQLPLVVVVRRSLGTLNHTLLTLEAATTRRLLVAGVVVNETTPPRSLAEESNVEELRRRLAVPILAVVPFDQDPDAALCQVEWLKLASSEHANG